MTAQTDAERYAEAEELFDEGRALLTVGHVKKAHLRFQQVAELSPYTPFLGDALGIAIPDSFLIKLDHQIELHNAAIAKQAIAEVHYQYLDVRLLLIDMSANTYLTSPGIEVLSMAQSWPDVDVKLIDVHPRPAQILKMLGMHHLLWDDYSCPICGPDRACHARFGRRLRHEIPLPRHL